MKQVIQPGKISGKIKAPASKSMMQRAVAAAILCDEPVEIINSSFCNDGLSALDIAKGFGKKVSIERDKVILSRAMTNPKTELNVGESGLGIRMFSPIAALFDKEITINGAGSLTSRPVSMIEKGLVSLGAKCKSEKGFVPVKITGPLKGGVAEIDGSLSSQLLTGLLIALPVIDSDTVLSVHDLKSRPYIDMTLELMSEFGVEVENHDYEEFVIPGGQKYECNSYKVEGDWSGAAFLLVAGAIGGNVEVAGLSDESFQADKAIVEALELAGAEVKYKDEKYQIKKDKLNAFDFDATHCPDLFPPLVVLAANCEGTTTIEGANRLTHKESDRAAVLKSEFEKLGVEITVEGDLMKIQGGTIQGGTIDSHNDHRIAMAGACAAINAQSEITITDPECVNKSWPDFFEDFGKILK